MFFYNELKPLLHKISSNSEDLSSVQLSHKKITDKNLLQISDALQTNSHVDEIWLTNNFITEVGSLTGVLEKNESVAEVYLGGNKIGDQGGETVVDAYFMRIYLLCCAVKITFHSVCLHHACMHMPSFVYCGIDQKEYNHY